MYIYLNLQIISVTFKNTKENKENLFFITDPFFKKL